MGEVDVSKVTYKVYATTSSGQTLNITQAVQGLGWEEGEDEIAMKMTFELYNATYNGQKLSSLIKIGCVVRVKANWGSGNDVVATGTIVSCERSTTKSAEIFSIDARDNLFYLQKSQDNVYFKAGKGTKSAISSVLSSWGISLSEYSGPNVTHAKIVYKSSYVSDIIRDILDEARKKGGCKAILRSTKGKVGVVKVGGNSEVYHFTSSNSISSKYKISIVDMVTRVKIVASEKTDGLPKVEAVVNGKTSYGVFQRILNHASSDKLPEAKTTAQEMLDEKGSPEETCTVEAPDVPPIRKGDKVNLKVGALNGNYIVKSIQHNAASGKMTMQVEKQ